MREKQCLHILVCSTLGGLIETPTIVLPLHIILIIGDDSRTGVVAVR